MAAADWKRLLKDKRVWAGAGVVAAIAVVVVIRNRPGGDGGAAVGSGAAPAAPSGYWQGTGDTTGTDLAGFLGNWGNAQLSAQQQGFQSVLDALAKLPGGTPNDQADTTQPSVVWSRDPSGKPVWALLNSPYGSWMTTTSQQAANEWASQWEPDQNANFVSWDAFGKLQSTLSK